MNQAQRHFYGTGLIFLAFETVILFLAGGPFGSDSAVLFLLIAAAGGIGYLALGALAGSPLSLVFIAVPILIAVAVGGTASDGSTASEVPLYVSWTSLTIYFFAPAWLVGLLVSLFLRAYLFAPE